MKSPNSKIVSLSFAKNWRMAHYKSGKEIVVTNGCFDIMHAGHAEYLYEAKKCGDYLIVLLNGDKAIRELKGDTRPVIDEYCRSYMLASLEAVDLVVMFYDKRCTDELHALKPDIYVKGADYSLDKLDIGERAVLERCGTEIKFIPLVIQLSTSKIIERLKL